MTQRTRGIFAAGSTLLAAVAVAGAQASSALPPRVLAEVGGRTILTTELEEARLEERRRAVATNTLSALTTAAKEQTLQRLIDLRRFAVEARARKLELRPDVARRIDNAIDTILSETLKSEIAAAAATDGAALRRYYDAHIERFREPGRVRARHVVVTTEAEALAILGRLRRQGDFAALARDHNIDSTRDSAGDLGWVRRGTMVPAFDAALFSLRPGEVSQPVRTPYGYHLVQAVEIEPPPTRPFESVAEAVRSQVVEETLAAAKQALAASYPARIDAVALKAVR